MLQVSELYKQAETRLQNTQNAKKISLIHAAIALGASLLVVILMEVSDLLIAETGGLDGMATRAMLSTGRDILNLVVTVALPFWQIGIFCAALCWTKGENAEFSHLLQGFRRCFSVMAYQAMLILLYFVLILVVSFPASIIFLMTPLSIPFLNLLQPFIEKPLTPEQAEELLTPEFTESIMQASIPMLIISGILLLLAFIPIFYKIRFTEFGIMDGLSSFKALAKSFIITGKNFWNLVKLDLSFWWFYLLLVLSVVVSNADMLLPTVGVTLPIPDYAATLLFYTLGSLCQLLLLWQFEAKRVTVYGLAYRTLDRSLSKENTPQES